MDIDVKSLPPIPEDVSETFRDLVQECFSTIWDSSVHILPDPTLPIPTKEQISKVLEAIQAGYDKEYTRRFITYAHTEQIAKDRLSVDMLAPSVQIALVQAFIKGLSEYKVSHLTGSTDFDKDIADRVAIYRSS